MITEYYYFDLKGAVAEFYQQCPAWQNKVAIVDSAAVPFWTRRKLVTAAVNKVVPDIETNGKSLRSQFNEAIEKGVKHKRPMAVFPAPRLNLNFHIIVSPPSRMKKENMNSCLPGVRRLMDAEKEVLFQHHNYFVFDHEIGHALDKNVKEWLDTDEDKQNVKESIADNYAALRHVQRFGAKTSFLETWKHFRVIEAVMQNSLSHYTVHSLDNTENWLAHNDVTGRSPEELIRIATKIALESFNPDRHHDLAIPLHKDSKKLPLRQRFMRSPHEIAGIRFLNKSEHMNSPYIPQIWQKWCAALAYHGLPKKQIERLRQQGQDSHGHMNPTLPSQKPSEYGIIQELKR